MKIEFYKKNQSVPDSIEVQEPIASDYKFGKITFLENVIVIRKKNGIHIYSLFKKPINGLLEIEGGRNIRVNGQGGGVKLYTHPFFSF